MKKTLLTLLMAMPFVLAAQLTMEDFESYNAGSFDSQWNASNWTGWFGGPSGSTISNEQALSGTKSVKIETNNDLVALLGILNTGTYEISFRIGCLFQYAAQLYQYHSRLGSRNLFF
jgi:hypothetical protein